MRGLEIVKYEEGGSIEWSLLKKFLKRKLEQAKRTYKEAYLDNEIYDMDLRHYSGIVEALEDLLRELEIER